MVETVEFLSRSPEETARLGERLAGSLEPGAHVELQLRFHKVDWRDLDESDDYSFDPTKTEFADWERVTLYLGRSRVWGVEPGAAATPTPTASGTPAPPTPTFTATPTASPPTPTPTPGDGLCTAPPWDPEAVYWGGDEVAHDDHQWRARWWPSCLPRRRYHLDLA